MIEVLAPLSKGLVQLLGVLSIGLLIAIAFLDKDITKKISRMNIIINWRVYDNSDLLHYYTGGDGILGDVAIYEHTKLLLNDINKVTTGDKVKIYLSKPLTTSICMV